METLVVYIKKVIEKIFIIFSILFYFNSIVIPVSANSISYDPLHHSYRVIHDNFIERESIPTTIGSSFDVNQNVVVLSGNMFFGVSSDAAAETGAEAVQYTKSSLSLGREMHSGYKLAEHAPELGRFKEFGKVPGIRPDFVDFSTKTIYELKPFNPRAMQQGVLQLNKYQSIFEQRFGGVWNTVLDTY